MKQLAWKNIAACFGTTGVTLWESSRPAANENRRTNS
jgi:hypothetical protein